MWKKGLPFVQDLGLENSADSYLCFRPALLYFFNFTFFSVSHLFYRYTQFVIPFYLT